VGRYAGGGLVRVVRSFFRPTRPQKRLGKAQTPTRLVDCRKLIALDLQAIALDLQAIDACEIRFSARIIELLVYLSASDKVRAHRFFRALHALKIRVFRQRASSVNDLQG
jgi:hypothetical protein